MDDDVVPLQRKQRQGAPAMFPPAPGSGTGAGSGADTTDEADVTGLTLSRTNAPAPARRSKPPSYRDLWLRFAAGSCAGRKANGATKANQDSYAIKTRVCGLKHAHIFGVFDGHGKLGHYVSGFVRDNLPDILAAELRTLPEDSLLYNARRRLTRSAQETELGRLAQCMKRALNETERRLNESPIEAYLSGTTAVVLLLIGRHAIVGNVGDSRCVLGSTPDVRDADRHGLDVVDGGLADKHVPRHARRSSAGLADVSTEHVLINARGLTVDQKPGDPSERARIESMGGFVQPILNRATNAFVGPDRVWSTKVQGRLPGLAMSRSIGDGCAGDVGVISDPVVTYHYLRPGRDHFLVLASDGVWEFIPNSEALDVVKNHSEPTDAAVALCRAAQQKWISTMGKLGSNVVDDITALVLCLWPTPQKSGSTSASSVGSRDSPASELTQ